MKQHAQKIIGALALLIAAALTPSAKADLVQTVDVNPDPDVFECYITASERDVTIDGSTVHALVYKDESAAVPPASAGIPILVMNLKVGEKVICHFVNQLSTESAGIHWHGLELDNDSDGTPISQDAVLPGQSYTYQFETFRPGTFWFHPHMLPGNTLFGGMYGVIIIENNIEASLKGTTLPDDANTHTLAMSDIDFDASGIVGKDFGGVTKKLNELVELCHLHNIGDPGGDMAACNTATVPGSIVLVNGQKPDAVANTPMFVVPSGQRVRLRLLSESISRHFRLKLLNSGDNKLYRIGGQGGLLDNVVLEGGTKGTWVTTYDVGEILVGPGERDDVIVVRRRRRRAIRRTAQCRGTNARRGLR
jgi:FtsP/CotA-like multicopper oxidase with cupredoxin domain